MTAKFKMYDHKGLTILPKQDFGRQGNHEDDGTWKGWLVTSQRMNVLPGATWARTVGQARVLADAYLEAGGNPNDPMNDGCDADRFWQIVRSLDANEEKAEDRIGADPGLSDLERQFQHKIERAADDWRELRILDRRLAELKRERNKVHADIIVGLRNVPACEGVFKSERGDVAFKISDHELDEIIAFDEIAGSVTAF